MTLKTELSQEKHQWTLSLIGFVNANTAYLMWFADSSQALLKRLVEAKVNSLIIDLSRTEAIDSQGLRLLIDAHMEFTAKNVQITLRQPNTHLSRLFRIMQFDRLFIVDPPDLT
jgi:anti-anti-sigma factor